VRRSLPIAPSDSRIATPRPVPPRPAGWTPGPLTDARGRRITYLRASVTDRCNMACVYCMPPGGEAEHAPRPDILGFEELVRIVRVLAGAGVRRVRLTGGEPLARRDVVRLAAMLKTGGAIEELVMTTNGARLATLARPLREAGVDGVNVSIDSLDRDRFAAITRGGDLGEVLAGIHAALEAGLEVKVNAVVLGGENDRELGAIVDWAWSLGIVPRFIELMPIGEAAHLPREAFVPASEIVSRLGERVVADGAEPAAGRGPARYLRAADGSDRRVGIISAVSDHFCDGCNRVRLTSRGDLRACLASRNAVSLRDLARAGAGDEDLVWATAWSLGSKDAGHSFSDSDVSEHRHVGMSLVGG
jgi:cyclic pyranopterin phosphate synthase